MKEVEYNEIYSYIRYTEQDVRSNNIIKCVMCPRPAIWVYLKNKEPLCNKCFQINNESLNNRVKY